MSLGAAHVIIVVCTATPMRAMCGGKKWPAVADLLVLSIATSLLSRSTEAASSMSLAVGMRVILDPHIMTRTSSHEPNQLIHRGGPPYSCHPPLLSAKLHRGCSTTALLFPLPNYLLINYQQRNSHCSVCFVFFFTVVSRREFPLEVQKDIRALDLSNGHV